MIRAILFATTIIGVLNGSHHERTLAEKVRWITPFVGKIPKGVTYETNYFEQLYSFYTSMADDKLHQLKSANALKSDKRELELKENEEKIEKCHAELGRARKMKSGSDRSELVGKLSAQLMVLRERHSVLEQRFESEKDSYQESISDLEKEAAISRQHIRNPVISFKGSMELEEIYKFIMSKRAQVHESSMFPRHRDMHFPMLMARYQFLRTLPFSAYSYNDDVTLPHHLLAFCETLEEMRHAFRTNVLEPRFNEFITAFDLYAELEEEGHVHIGGDHGFVDVVKARAQLKAHGKYLRQLKWYLSYLNTWKAKMDSSTSLYRQSVITFVSLAKLAKRLSTQGKQINLGCLSRIELAEHVQPPPSRYHETNFDVDLEVLEISDRKASSLSFDKYRQHIHAITEHFKLIETTNWVKLAKLGDETENIRHLYQETIYRKQHGHEPHVPEDVFKKVLYTEGLHLAYDDFRVKMWELHIENVQTRIALNDRIHDAIGFAISGDEAGIKEAVKQCDEIVAKHLEETTASASESEPTEVLSKRDLYIYQTLRSKALKPGQYTYKSNIPNHHLIVHVSREGELEWYDEYVETF